MKYILGLCVFLTGSLSFSKAPMEGVKLSAPLPANLWIEMSKMAQPGVVGIYLDIDIKRTGFRRDPLYDFVEEFFGRGFEYEDPRKDRDHSSPIGTGFLIDDQGYIVTNYHVIEPIDDRRLRTKLQVQISGEGELHEVEVLGRDPRGDLALLKLKKKLNGLKPLQFGNSDKLQVGEHVAAFGNPYGHSNSMTVGIVSAIGRAITELNRFPFIQTDASINPGNSGGPLLNTQGYVIGVNTAIDARAQGIGFAIPASYVKKVVEIMKAGGTIQRGYLGVGLAQLHPRAARAYGLKKRGVVIANVQEGYPGDKAGLKENDVVFEFNNTPVTNTADFISLVQDSEVGKTYSIKVMRPGEDRFIEKELQVTLTHFPGEGRRPDEPPGNKKNSPWLSQKEKQNAPKYAGAPAPFALGFSVTDSSSGARRAFDIPIRYPFGPIVSRVKPGSPAERAGIRKGFVVITVNGQSPKNAEDFLKSLVPSVNRIWFFTPKGEKKISILPE